MTSVHSTALKPTHEIRKHRREPLDPGMPTAGSSPPTGLDRIRAEHAIDLLPRTFSGGSIEFCRQVRFTTRTREDGMRRMRVAYVGLAALLVASVVQARRPHNADGESVSPRLTAAHTRHVEEGINHVLDAGLLSPAQEMATRAGLEAFLASSAAGEPESSPGLSIDSLDFQPLPGFLEATGSGLQSDGRLTPLPSGLVSLGRVNCTIGNELFLNSRFFVAVDFQGYSGPALPAFACGLTPSSGYFFWTDFTNMEIPIKMLNTCAWANPPGHWVFAAGLTTFAVQITVFDFFTGIRKTYTNGLGHTFNTQLDQSTPFPCP